MSIKDAWRWFVRNVRETRSMEPIAVELERVREAAVELGAQNPPGLPLYRFRLGLRAGFSGEAEATIPVFRRVNPHPHPVLKEIYHCEVAGNELEAANVEALRDKVARMLETLAPAGSLPLAYFRVPEMDYSLPVYEEGGEVVCPVLAGPKLKARELGTVRRHVYRYLLNAGYVSHPSQVEIQVVRPSDLRLVPPAALISSLEDPELWLATVEGHSAEGIVIGLLGESTELKRDERPRAGIQSFSGPPAATDVASLLRMIGNELAQADRLEDPFSLYASQVRGEIWARTEHVTEDVGHSLECWLDSDGDASQLRLPLRRSAAGEMVTALEDQGIRVFVAADEATLAAKVGAYLSEHGFLRWKEAVEVVPGRHAAVTSAAAPSGDRIVAGSEIEFSRLEFEAPETQPEEQNEEVGHT